MKVKDTTNFENRKARIESRLAPQWQPTTEIPVLSGANCNYEIAQRTNAVFCGGIGLIHEVVRSVGLASSVDRRLDLLRSHRPYHESDHVLNMAYNIMTGGTCLEDIERLRNDESYLDILGTRRIPDPTTAGDFLRRFRDQDVIHLMEGINEARVNVWKTMPRSARKIALIDVDGTHAPTNGEKKEGIDINYKGEWGYSPLVVSLANTQEVLSIKNRSGNEVSHSDAVAYMDRAVDLVRAGGFRRCRLRGDTAFSLTTNFDRWDSDGVEFVFGMDAHPALRDRAENIAKSSWRRLHRRKVAISENPTRSRRPNFKQEVVKERGFKSYALEYEDIAEIPYQPSKCQGSYRLIVLRKTISVQEGQLRLYDEVRYFFYITNVLKAQLGTADVVRESNARCHQENVIEQLKNGVAAMRLPSHDLSSNWAYMVIAALAWNLKAWLAILTVDPRSAQEIARMEFRRFVRSVILLPCQVVRSGRRTILRILSYSNWIPFIVDAMTHFKRLRLT